MMERQNMQFLGSLQAAFQLFMIFQWKLVDGLSRRIRPPGSRKQIFWQRLILLKVIFLAVKVSMKVFSCNLWKWTFVKVRKIGVNLHIFLLCFPAFCTVRQARSTGIEGTGKETCLLHSGYLLCWFIQFQIFLHSDISCDLCHNGSH